MYRIIKKIRIGKIYYRLFKNKVLGKKKLSSVDDNEIQRLNAYYPNKGSSAIRKQKRVIGREYDLCIIIPAYNVEKYIINCIESILKQETQYRFQVIVIEDGATDHTAEQLKRYKDSEKIKIIHQENKGLSGARNRGLDESSAEYIMFVDADDMLVQGAVDKMMKCAYYHNADIVEGAYAFISASGRIKYQYKQKEGFLDRWNDLYGFAWGKLYRNVLFETVNFPEGYWFEDSVCRQIIYELAECIVGIQDTVYMYQENPKGITHKSKGNLKSLDVLWITKVLFKDREKLMIHKSEAYYYYLIKLAVLIYERTRGLDEQIRKSIFISYSYFLNAEFSSYLSREELSDIEYAIKEYDFGIYELWCKCY